MSYQKFSKSFCNSITYYSFIEFSKTKTLQETIDLFLELPDDKIISIWTRMFDTKYEKDLMSGLNYAPAVGDKLIKVFCG